MRKLLRILPLLALLLLPLGQAVAASITVTASTDAMAMANALASTGITVNSATLVQGASTQQGFFTGGTGNLPFDSGILLTTGSIQNAVGPNNLVNTTTDIGSAGDVQLSSLAGYATHDANILHIVFTPTSNVISFQFAFGSEEYNYFVNSQFNDVFAFYLNGANIALVPGTTDPISVNSIDCLHNAAYYVNNDPFNTTLGGCAAGSNAGLDMEYNGFAGGLGALPLYATGAVNPNVQNTIDLKIADGSDDLLDSGIFLAADSFKPEPPPTVPEPASLLLLASGLGSLGLLRKKLRK